MSGIQKAEKEAEIATHTPQEDHALRRAISICTTLSYVSRASKSQSLIWFSAPTACDFGTLLFWVDAFGVELSLGDAFQIHSKS